MSELFVTSDTHFGHFNIIRYTNRPFTSLEEMDKELIRRWNSRVKPQDTVIHLGDFCFKNSPGGKEGEGTTNKSSHYRDMLNGEIIVLRGNHDNNNSTKSHITSLELEFGKRMFWLTHRPQDYNSDYRYNLVGHVHDKWLHKKYESSLACQPKSGYVHLINVGVDQHNFHPIKMTEVLRIISRIERNDK